LNRWKGDEPWKRKEPGGRLSNSAKKSQKHFKMQRQKMERKHTQDVKIILHNTLLRTPGLFNTFTVKMNIPLRKAEIDKRMAAAFPELEWRKS